VNKLHAKGRAIVYRESKQIQECLKLSLLDLSDELVYSRSDRRLIAVPALWDSLTDQEIEDELIDYLAECYPEPSSIEILDLHFDLEVEFETITVGLEEDVDVVFSFIIRAQHLVTNDEQAINDFMQGEEENEGYRQ
jgi:hypothetical protein